MNNLTEIQKEMLRQMLEWDREYSYGYDWFDGIADKKILKKEMRELISSGLVEMFRGGVDEDGQLYGGCGFSINYDRRTDIEKLLSPSTKSIKQNN